MWRSTAGAWWRYFLRALALAALLVAGVLVAPAGQPALGMAAALVVWLGCAGVLEYLIDCLLWQRRHRTGHLVFRPDRLVLSDDEIQMVCIHEAGHLMLYGLLNRLPEDAFAMVDTQVTFEFGGFVSALSDITPADMTGDLLAWSAMMAFGGAAAEQVVLGRSPAESAGADFDIAERLLRRLAAIDPAQVFMRKPATPDEEAINARAIAALRAELFARAVRYLEANRAGMVQVAAHLRQHHSMDCEQFAPVWAGTVTPPGYERLDPPARVACLAMD